MYIPDVVACRVYGIKMKCAINKFCDGVGGSIPLGKNKTDRSKAERDL